LIPRRAALDQAVARALRSHAGALHFGLAVRAWIIMPTPASQAFGPARDRFQRLVTREVDVDRRQRDPSFLHRVEIGAGPGVLRRTGRADPPDRPAARVALADRRLGAMAVAEPAHAPAADLSPRAGRAR
jgi:hypothetical protein